MGDLQLKLSYNRRVKQGCFSSLGPGKEHEKLLAWVLYGTEQYGHHSFIGMLGVRDNSTARNTHRILVSVKLTCRWEEITISDLLILRKLTIHRPYLKELPRIYSSRNKKKRVI